MPYAPVISASRSICCGRLTLSGRHAPDRTRNLKASATDMHHRLTTIRTRVLTDLSSLGRRLRLTHQRQQVILTVLEERHPLLGPVRVPVDHVRRGIELDAA